MTSDVQRYGLIGGTFNPIHWGHIKMAQAASVRTNLDKVFFVPSFGSLHRDCEYLAPFNERAIMTQLGIMDYYPHFATEFTKAEERVAMRDQGKNIWESFHDKYGAKASLSLILGLDRFYDFPDWPLAPAIMDQYDLIVIARPGWDESNYFSFIDNMALLKSNRGRIHFVENPVADISSTLIRQMLAQGQSINDYVPMGVQSFIEGNGLYKNE